MHDTPYQGEHPGPPGASRLGLLLAGFILGVALQLQQAVLWSGWVYASAMGAALVAWVGVATGWRAPGRPLARRLAHPRREAAPARWRGPTAAVASLLWLMLALVVGGSLTGWRASGMAGQRLDAALEGVDLDVTGVVSAMPQRNDGGLRFRLEVASATQEGVPVAVPPHITLGWYGGVVSGAGLDEEGVTLQRQPPELRAGERWQMTVRLKAPHGNLNPHGFDYELWLWEQGLQATGYVRAGPRDPVARRLDATWRHPVERARQAVRGAILSRLGGASAAGSDSPAMAQRLAGVVAALVTGDQSAIDRADWDIFRATGVAHLMSISGLHITLFAWVAAAVVGALWRQTARWGWRWCLVVPAPTAALLGGVLLATAYAVFSGWGVPAQRTVWMLATVSVLRLAGRQWPWPAVWLLACAVVVALDPWALTQAGFWLSFVAVGVLFASADTAHATGAARRPAGLGGRWMTLLREQWVVTLALTPLSLLLFGQVSLVGLLANLVAIPWVTLVVTPLALAGTLWAPLWNAAAWALQPLSQGLEVLARLPLATASTAAPALWAAAAGVMGGVLLVMRLPWGMRAMGLPLLLPVLLWQAPRPLTGQFELLAADIGQGNAVIVRTATHTLVYDAGPRFSAESDAGHRVLVPLLRALGEQVDVLMLSHRDTDHTGGARAVLAMQPQAALTGSMADDHALQAVRPVTRCAAGQRWAWDGVQFEVLHPQAADYALTHKPNAMSCVLRIGNGQQSALLAGDIEAAQEAQLLARQAGTPGGLRADVLLVPHHGSKTSSTAVFLDAVQPQWALVQAGYRNRFGHPALPVIGRYRERGIAVMDSARCGAARWSSAEPGQMHCEREVARRYWHHPGPGP